MSNNISSVKVLKLDAWMRAKDVLRFGGSDELPESSFLDDMIDAAREANKDSTKIPLKDLEWCGSGSGYSTDLLRQIAKSIHGTAEGVRVYESGYLEGFRISDGKLTAREVVMSLGAEIQREGA